MSLVQLCSREFSKKLKERGADYQRRGKVHIGEQTKTSLVATVAGSEDYDVKLDWSEHRNGEVTAACSCPYYLDHGNCKHIWATILQADVNGLGRGLPAHRVLSLVSDYDDDENDGWEKTDLDTLQSLLAGDAREFVRKVVAREISPQPRKGLRNDPPPGRWQQQLGQLNWNSVEAPGDGDMFLPAKQREVRYVLDVGFSQQADGVTIHLLHRETKQNGEFGKFKALSLSTSELESWRGTQDYELLRLLLLNDQANLSRGGYGYYSSYGPAYTRQQVVLGRTASETLLPELCQTGRFVWMLARLSNWEDASQPVSWDTGPAWQFRLKVADDCAKQWVVRGELYRPGAEESVPIAQPVLFLSNGLLLLDDRLSRVELGASAPWIAVLRRDESIVVPYSERRSLLAALWKAPQPPEMILPESLRPVEVRGEPCGHLRIEKPRYGERLAVKVHFHYEDQQVRPLQPGSGLLSADGKTLYVRDRAKERELAQQVVAAGARRMQSYNRSQAEYDLEITPKALPKLTSVLMAAGWQIEAVGGLIRPPGEFRLSVTSGVDWFQLDGEFDFGNEKVRLPELLAAMRRGEKFVKLGDGTQGILPEAWLARFGALADLGQTEAGELRFRPTQALLLDALLASQRQVSFDMKFGAIRDKLQAFRGIQPAEAPPGFCGELRDYQKEGLGWLGFLREFGFGGCLADDMGLGKTIQVLALLEDRRKRKLPSKGTRRPSLVVVPRSLVFNWMEEARKFTPELRVLDFAQPERGPLLDQFQDYDLIVTTYGTLLRDVAKLKDVAFDYAILDESQAIKNPQSQSAKACRLLQADNRLALTGTPVENHLGELWSLFEFLNPGMLGHSTAFQRFSSGASSSSSSVREASDDAAAALRSLSQAVAPFLLRRTKEQVLKELPAKTEQTIYCDLSKKERKHYDELRDYYRASLTQRIADEGMEKSKIHVLEALLRLRQAACHVGLVDKQRTSESSAKLETLFEQLAEIVAEGHKALVFSQFTSLLAIVRAKLDAQQVAYEYLDGRTRDRQSKVDRFQTDAECPLFLVSLKAGGRGLNLTAADYVFILDPWWNPAVESQAVDRAHRLGQTRHVFAYRLIARDTVEEKILELQRTKRDLADAILSADRSFLQKLTAEDLRMLLS